MRDFRERRRRDSNPGWRICNQTSNPQNPEENLDSREGAAQSAAAEAENGPIDPDLASVIEAWGTLPPAIREAILSMLRAAE